MTDEEWGQQEHSIRLGDLAEMKAGNLTLGDIQARAERRRKQAGFSLEKATALVSASTRRIREQMQKARAKAEETTP